VQPGVGLSTQEAALLLALVARTERGRAPEVAAPPSPLPFVQSGHVSSIPPY